MKKKRSILPIVITIIVVIVAAGIAVYEYGVAGTSLGCKLRGGEWTRYGLSPDPICLMKTKDAGQTCTDSDQCEGSCVSYEEGLKRGDSAKGICTSHNTLVGCFTSIEDGKVEMSLCVD